MRRFWIRLLAWMWGRRRCEVGGTYVACIAGVDVSGVWSRSVAMYH